MQARPIPQRLHFGMEPASRVLTAAQRKQFTYPEAQYGQSGYYGAGGQLPPFQQAFLNPNAPSASQGNFMPSQEDMFGDIDDLGDVLGVDPFASFAHQVPSQQYTSESTAGSQAPRNQAPRKGPSQLQKQSSANVTLTPSPAHQVQQPQSLPTQRDTEVQHHQPASQPTRSPESSVQQQHPLPPPPQPSPEPKPSKQPKKKKKEKKEKKEKKDKKAKKAKTKPKIYTSSSESLTTSESEYEPGEDEGKVEEEEKKTGMPLKLRLQFASKFPDYKWKNPNLDPHKSKSTVTKRAVKQSIVAKKKTKTQLPADSTPKRTVPSRKATEPVTTSPANKSGSKTPVAKKSTSGGKTPLSKKSTLGGKTPVAKKSTSGGKTPLSKKSTAGGKTPTSKSTPGRKTPLSKKQRQESDDEDDDFQSPPKFNKRTPTASAKKRGFQRRKVQQASPQRSKLPKSAYQRVDVLREQMDKIFLPRYVI